LAKPWIPNGLGDKIENSALAVEKSLGDHS